MTDDNYIQSALTQYGIPNAKYELLRHNENMTVKVGEQYLLRIHKHAEGFTSVPIYEGFDRDKIRRTELSLLCHMNECGMRVQSPIPNKAGELLTVLADGTCATMLEWISGHTLDKDDVNYDLSFRIGAMVAQMHQAVQNFYPDEILDYDAALCGRIGGKLAQEAESGRLKKKYASVLRAACCVMGNRLEKNQKLLVVHADLSKSNILITDAGLVPIDFSLFGRGNPMMDIGVLYGSLGSLDHRRAIAEGYRSNGGEIDFPMLDVCYALNVMLYIILHIKTCEEKNLDRWCNEIFGPLSDGKQLIQEDFFMPNISH